MAIIPHRHDLQTRLNLSSHIKPTKLKKLIPLFLVCISLHGIAQKVTVDSNGNYHSIKVEDKKTDKVYIDDKGQSYPVYINSTGKLYVIRKSKKTGKEYKSYLKTA